MEVSYLIELFLRSLLVILAGVDPHGFRTANSGEPVPVAEVDCPAICNKHILMVSFSS